MQVLAHQDQHANGRRHEAGQFERRLQQRGHDQEARDLPRAQRVPELLEVTHRVVRHDVDGDAAQQRLEQLVDRMGGRHVRLLAAGFALGVRPFAPGPFEPVIERAVTAHDHFRLAGGAGRAEHESGLSGRAGERAVRRFRTGQELRVTDDAARGADRNRGLVLDDGVEPREREDLAQARRRIGRRQRHDRAVRLQDAEHRRNEADRTLHVQAYDGPVPDRQRPQARGDAIRGRLDFRVTGDALAVQESDRVRRALRLFREIPVQHQPALRAIAPPPKLGQGSRRPSSRSSRATSSR